MDNKDILSRELHMPERNKSFDGLEGASVGEVHSYELLKYCGNTETSRASRYALPYAIVMVKVSPLEGASIANLPKLEEKIIDRIFSVIRTCDTVGKTVGSTYAVLLPQTDYFGSLITTRKLLDSFEPLSGECSSYAKIEVMQASYPHHGDTFDKLIDVAEERIRQKRNSLWSRLSMDKKIFWEMLESVSALEEKSMTHSGFETSPDGDLKEDFLESLNAAILNEIILAPKKRGILYFSMPKISRDQPLVKKLQSVFENQTKIYVVGDRVDVDFDNPNIIVRDMKDQRLLETSFTLFMNKDVAYGVFSKESWGGVKTCFHTSDKFLVEGMITRLQRDYALEENF